MTRRICRIPSTMKSIILIVLTTMLTIANTEAYPSPKESFQSRCNAETGCDWALKDRVRSYFVLLESVASSLYISVPVDIGTRAVKILNAVFYKLFRYIVLLFMYYCLWTF